MLHPAGEVAGRGLLLVLSPPPLHARWGKSTPARPPVPTTASPRELRAGLLWQHLRHSVAILPGFSQQTNGCAAIGTEKFMRSKGHEAVDGTGVVDRSRGARAVDTSRRAGPPARCSAAGQRSFGSSPLRRTPVVELKRVDARVVPSQPDPTPHGGNAPGPPLISAAARALGRAAGPPGWLLETHRGRCASGRARQPRASVSQKFEDGRGGEGGADPAFGARPRSHRPARGRVRSRRGSGSKQPQRLARRPAPHALELDPHCS